MNTGVRFQRALSAGLLAIIGVIAAILYLEWTRGLALEQRLQRLRKVPETAATIPIVLPEFVLPDAEAGFPELASRSLFVSNRRSSGAATKGGRSAMKKGQFVLVGVMVTPKQTSVLLRDIRTNKTETVAKTAEIRGMTVSDVTASSVILRQGAEFEELPLIVQTGAKAIPSTTAQVGGVQPPPMQSVGAPVSTTQPTQKPIGPAVAASAADPVPVFAAPRHQDAQKSLGPAVAASAVDPAALFGTPKPQDGAFGPIHQPASAPAR